ncbi:MAG: penicillin acylase family protein [Gemmatimonadota bacterium]
MKHTRFRRRAFFAALVALWSVGLAVTFAWFRLAASADRPDGPVELAGLSDTVTVELDTLGIPTIRARVETDAWRALGYMHASDRLWQLEFLRRIASGRLAELFGETAYPTDRFTRTLGLARMARDAADELSRGERGVLEAYVDGVNARLAAGGPLPPEFAVLRVEPEPWTVEHSLSVGLVMSLDLSHWRRDLSRHWAALHLPEEKAAGLHPRYPDWGPRTLDGRIEPPSETVTGFEPDDPSAPGDPSAAGDPSTPGDPSAAGAPSAIGPSAAAGGVRPETAAWDPLDVLSAVSARAASNAWVVGGSRTASGYPILANDMHLALRSPSTWYVAALHVEPAGLDVAGFTLPGLPGVVVGFNRRVAWGATNAMVDDMDLAVETVDDRGLYREGDRWLDFEARPETIRVRGAEPRVDTVRATVRGPVVSDALGNVPGTLSAIFLPDRVPVGLGGLLAMNRATSLEGFHAAAETFTQPHLNLVIAGSDGRIGYHLAGSIPLRSWDGALPAPAEVVGDGWRGMWPRERHPATTAPARDFVASANNLQAEGLDGAVGADWPVPFRAERITRALAVRRDWTPEATLALQRDVRSLLADRTIGRAIEAARRIGAADAADTLADWDRMVEVDSRAAPLFYTWFYGLRSLVAADEWSEAPDRAFFPVVSMLRILDGEEANPWVDDVSTPDVRETLAELEERAMAAAIERIDGRSWGEVHEERHAHPLGASPLLDRLFGFHVGPHPAPGGPNTVRPDAYQIWQRIRPGGPTPPWTSEYGPSERLVVEMRPSGPRARALLPTGQSGNPFSPHYRDMNAAWRAGELVPLALGGDRDRPAPTDVLVLAPEIR